MSLRWARPAALVALAALAVGACSFDGLAFIQDRRLEFVSPEDRELVRLPVTIDWEVEDLEIGPGAEERASGAGASEFAVFIDQRPQPPGEPLSWHAEDDETCQLDPGCPDDEWYRLRGIHTTTDTSFTIERLPRPTEEGRREMHTITVVLLDASGVRIGESAWQLEIEIDRTRS